MSASETNLPEDTAEFVVRPVAERGVVAKAGPTMSLEFGAGSHVGLRRPNNEDHYAVVERKRARKILLTNVEMAGLTLPDDEAYGMIVADGMGGQGFGELASELVLRIGWEVTAAAPFWVMKYTPRLMDKIREKVAGYARQIQQELREYADADPALAGMGTTWTCAYIMESDVILAHVGDTRAHLLRDGTLRQLTRDHTFAQTLRDAGAPPAETEPYKHLLLNSFGDHPEDVKIDVDHVALADGDRLMLCSDGLTDMVSDNEITATLVQIAGAQAACDALIDRALANGGKDNVTVVVAVFRAV
jgi:protein phosphatase